MKIDTKKLRSLYQEQIRSRAGRSRRDCPGPEKISALIESRLSGKKAARIIGHLSGCVHCSEELRFLAGVFRAEETLIQDLQSWQEANNYAALSGRGVSEKPGLKGRWRVSLPRFSWKTVSVAAACLLTVVVIFSTLVFRGPEKFRADSPRRVELIEPVGQKLSRSAPVFRWKSVLGCEYYVLGLFDEKLEPVWKSEKTGVARLALPPEIALRLPLNRPYFWMVTAFAEGEQVSSVLERFVLAE